MNTYQLYSMLNVHVSRTDEEVTKALDAKLNPSWAKIKGPVAQPIIDAVLAEHHAAQQLVKEMRF
jgi:hypothetical protein